MSYYVKITSNYIMFCAKIEFDPYTRTLDAAEACHICGVLAAVTSNRFVDMSSRYCKVLACSTLKPVGLI